MARVSAGHKLGEGEMRVLDIDGTKVSIAAAGGCLYAFDDRLHAHGVLARRG
jgi:hypothetical protein